MSTIINYCKLINTVIEKNYLLRYSGTILHAFPVYKNIMWHNCLITNLWKITHLTLLLTSYLNHSIYKTLLINTIDKIIVCINGCFVLYLFYRDVHYIDYFNICQFNILFLTPFLLYVYGERTNTGCFSKDFGFLIHGLCHLMTAIMCVLVLQLRLNIINIQ